MSRWRIIVMLVLIAAPFCVLAAVGSYFLWREGWGLTASEAMTARVPVITPDHTSFSEMLANGRGFLVPCRETAAMREDWDQIRPVADVEAMAAAACTVLDAAGFR